jgi:two-component system response regulator AtoC
MQVKLLRVLQERKFTPVGSNREIEMDVRIIAAINRNLEEMIKAGTFREDLFYRLNVMPIFLPPLRDRIDDIPSLVTHFIKKFSKEHTSSIVGISQEAINALKTYRWPGNIRELSNAIRSAVVLADNVIEPEHLPTSIRFYEQKEAPASAIPPVGDAALRDVLKKVEREHIVATLEKTAWNRTEAAKILGIDYKTLYNKMKEHGIAEV